jgi:hypothetical protein
MRGVVRGEVRQFSIFDEYLNFYDAVSVIKVGSLKSESAGGLMRRKG